MRKKLMANLSDTPINAAEAAVTSVATKWGMGGGTLAAVYGWVTHTGSAVFIGIVVTILGFAINWVYQQKRTKRERWEAEERLKQNKEMIEFQKGIALAEEARKIEMHQAQLNAIKHTQEKT